MFEKYLTKTGRISSSQPIEAKNYLNIQKFKQKHGDKYDYSLFSYQGQQVKIPIICQEHGIFYQLIQHHQSGRGCPYCQGNYRKSTEEIIKEFQLVHGDTYTYHNMEYKGNKEKVPILCVKHGEFMQSPHHHLLGKGCPDCQSEATQVYLLNVSNTNLYKIGITRNLKQRLSHLGNSNLAVVQSCTCTNPRYHESILHSRYSQFQSYYSNVTSGNTEFFQLSQEQVQEVIHYLESVQQGEF